MSRSGYNDDIENWDMIRWRGQVASATRGKRGQVFLRDLLTALDAMPIKELIAHELVDNGAVCAIGALGQARQVPMKDLDPEDYRQVAAAFDIAAPLAQEIVFENDEVGDWCGRKETPAERWARMRAWVASQITIPATKPDAEKA